MTRIAVVTLAMSCVACSSGPSTTDARGVLTQTAANLSRITSGELLLRVESEAGARGRSGLEIDGPFSFASPGTLPLADVEYTLFDRDGEERARFVSDGRAAYLVEAGDRPIPMSAEQIGQTGLASLVRGSDGRSVLEDLDIARWVAGTPEIDGGGRVGGVDTDKLTADLDVANAMSGLTKLAGRLGTDFASDIAPLQGADTETIRAAARDARIEIWSGKDDRILRRLVLTAEFGVGGRPLPGRLQELSGGSLEVEAVVTRLNDTVEVDLPR